MGGGGGDWDIEQKTLTSMFHRRSDNLGWGRAQHRLQSIGHLAKLMFHSMQGRISEVGHEVLPPASQGTNHGTQI